MPNMVTQMVVIVCAVFLLAAAWGQNAPPPAQDAQNDQAVTTLKVTTRLVGISAVVKSKDGEPKEGLGKDDFVLKQDGKGKGDAVRKGFAAASGDVLMILDADLTMPPEALPKFHAVIETGKAEFVNGTRLVYPMEHEAMRPLNLIANRFFAYLFSYLVNTRLTDTLCGTKVLLRKDYEVLARERDYFGNFDPFGDFDLIFGAAKQNLKIVETPIHYKARTFGETQISRFRDGWLLLKMVWFAYRKLKAI